MNDASPAIVSSTAVYHGKEKCVDPRVYLICFVLGFLSIVLIDSERGLAVVFIAAMVINVILGQGRFALSYLVAFLILLGIAWIGVQLLLTDPTNPMGLSLSSTGAIGRRILVPFSFIAGLGQQPTGTLLAAFRTLHMPKAFGIGLAVLLRFFPTLGEEYRSIRLSQKFRGVGLGIVDTLTHIPSTVEHILVPLVMRVSRLSDELSASVTVRGIRFGGETISYRPLGFSRRTIAAIVFFALCVVIASVLSQPGRVLS